MKFSFVEKIAGVKKLVFDKIGADREIIKIDTLIGKKTTIEGDLSVIGNCKIDGRIKGDVKVSGDLVIGEQGQISGNLSACNIIIAGFVSGNITAKGQLCVKKAAHISGEHTAHSITVEEGCSFAGNCSVTGGEQTV